MKTIRKAGKRFPLNMRTTKKMRTQLERAASSSGRSLCQEVEIRLEQSFRDDHVISLLRDELAEVVRS